MSSKKEPAAGGQTEPAEAALRRGEAAIALERYQVAIDEASKALAVLRDDVRPFALLASGHLGLERWEDARSAAERGLAIDPADPMLHRLRSLSYFHAGAMEEALAAADTALELDPDDEYAHVARGRALHSLGRAKGARRAFEQAVELAPEDPVLLCELGNHLLERDPRAAERHYRAALRLDPHDAECLNNLGVALNRQRREREAATAFKSALLLDPTLKEARENTYETVNGMLRYGAPIGLLILCGNLLRRSFWERRVDPEYVVYGMGLAGLAMTGLVVSIVIAERRQKKTLLESDPQLYEIYRRLEEDKRAGRL